MRVPVISCGLCRRQVNEKTLELVDPELHETVILGWDACSSCKAKSCEKVIAAMKIEREKWKADDLREGILWREFP